MSIAREISARQNVRTLDRLSITLGHAWIMRDDEENSPDAFRELTKTLTFRLARTQHRLNAQATRLLRECSDLSLVEWRVLRVLAAFDNCSMSKAAREAQIDKGQLSRKIKGMIDRGLIVTSPDPIDMRQHTLRLSVAGRQTHDRVLPVMQARQQRLKAGLGEVEIDTFLDVLECIYNNADESGQE